MPVDIAHLADTGKNRAINCDQTVAIGPEGMDGLADAFLLVADGMGATKRGDTASRITAEVVPDSFLERLRQIEGAPNRDALARALREAMDEANLRVWQEGQGSAELKGLGTTCVAAVVSGDTIVIGHAGDSRAYLLSGTEITQLTADHSMIQELVPSDERGVDLEDRFGTVITRGIGLSRTLDADLVTARLGPQDALLLCTDGLNMMLSDSRIASILASAPDAAAACRSLVEAANEAGGLDNIGVAVCRGPAFQPYEFPANGADTEGAAAQERRPARSRRRAKERTLKVLNVVLALLLIGVAVFAYWSETERRRLVAENEKIRKQFIQYVDQAESRRGRR